MLSDQWENLKGLESNLGEDLFTKQDDEKTQLLENCFVTLLTHFNYQSKDKSAIRISGDK
ncbi:MULTISPECIES: hypothetical protein [Chryseobacterium]|uniref:hypothetical protein n=1 Tax=Chryseobacterium TaxID=59732 RepID=UPI0024552552|nr:MULTISPECIES: hypothetical protein [Chryseobacterium]MDH5033753.1 hypothetical protein [Chryseobacterium cucumeris]MDR6462637.1 hypothetical protein [Chryseobacterium sediminis]